MLTTAALALLQYQSAQKRRNQCAMSQNSIASTISTASEASEDENPETNAAQLGTKLQDEGAGESILSMDDKFSSAAEEPMEG